MNFVHKTIIHTHTHTTPHSLAHSQYHEMRMRFKVLLCVCVSAFLYQPFERLIDMTSLSCAKIQLMFPAFCNRPFNLYHHLDNNISKLETRRVPKCDCIWLWECLRTRMMCCSFYFGGKTNKKNPVYIWIYLFVSFLTCIYFFFSLSEFSPTHSQ